MLPSEAVDGGDGAVDAGDGHAHPQVDVVLGVPLHRVHVDRVALVVAEQVSLGQRRALVREFWLGAEEHDLAVEALVAQRLGGLGPGQAGARDHEGWHAP